MNCLVTGAAGFIGSSLAKRLVEEGHTVKGLIHKNKPKYPTEKVEYIMGDVTDPESVELAVKNVDVVFHCAALVRDFGPRQAFHKVNVEGAKNLIKACEKTGVKRFIYLSHQGYGSRKTIGYYSETKKITEKYLKNKYDQDGFPTVIIRPGNVYGPGRSLWVLWPLKAIEKNRISLIDNGNGIFLHTYIDNLIDAMLSAMNEPKAIGEIIDVTDGDNNTTWGYYLNALAKMLGRPPVKKNMSKEMALFISKIMMLANRVFGIKPWVTPLSVTIFTNENRVSIENAKNILNYNPRIKLEEGLKQVEKYLKNENIVD